jgi:predicted nucleic acid-binding protein
MADDGQTTAGRMPLVLDASVAIKLVVEEPGTAESLGLLGREESRIAPDWLLIEAAAALWNKVKYSKLLEIHAEDSLRNLPEFFDELCPSPGLLASAFQLSFGLRHSVHDCLYLALALDRSCKVITADKAFAAAAGRTRFGDSVELMTW